MSSLEGTRVVIIGGSAGIGLATAKEAALRGASVVIAARGREGLEAAAAHIGRPVETHALDATEEEALPPFFAKVGPFDHLVTLVPSAPDAALAAKFTAFAEMEPAAFEIAFRNRFWSQCWAVRHGLRHMKATGSIVFMSSTQPRKAIPRGAAGSAASGAIEAFARVLALEIAPIRVNVIAPGLILTPGTARRLPEQQAAWERMTQSQVVKRLGGAQEIAEGILFLMENSYAAGTLLEIDGGYHLT